MTTLSVIGGGNLEVPDSLFARPYNGGLLHQLVVSYQANGRQGTRAQKTRAQVQHTTHKPWRQKGTGMARAGSRASPIWRGGGRSFPSLPDENFSHKVNRKAFRAGMAVLLSELTRESRLMVAEDLSAAEIKTKSVVEWLLSNNLTDRVLFVDSPVDKNFLLSARNLPKVTVSTVFSLSPLDLIYHDKTVISRRALEVAQQNWEVKK